MNELRVHVHRPMLWERVTKLWERVTKKLLWERVSFRWSEIPGRGNALVKIVVACYYNIVEDDGDGHLFTHLKLCPATATHNFKWMKAQYETKHCNS